MQKNLGSPPAFLLRLLSKSSLGKVHLNSVPGNRCSGRLLVFVADSRKNSQGLDVSLNECLPVRREKPTIKATTYDRRPGVVFFPVIESVRSWTKYFPFAQYTALFYITIQPFLSLLAHSHPRLVETINFSPSPSCSEPDINASKS